MKTYVEKPKKCFPKPVLLFIVFFFWGIALQAQNRNLLSNSYSKLDVREALTYSNDWVPFPNYEERSEWNKIPLKLREDYIKKGEKYLGYSWPTVTATLYLEFVRSGNRSIMQKTHGERQKAYQALVMAELMEGKGRFMDDIINGAFSFCEQTYWGLSAHLNIQKAGAGLPDVEDPTIDLGVGKLATDLAWSWYFFKTEFDKVNPLIANRIEKEIRDKVLIPYYEREDMWWMGFNTPFVNNWNPWCNYNVLNCILLMENDREKKAKYVHKTLRSVDLFLNYYKIDGGCDEGPSYWSHAGGKLFDYLDLLSKATDDKINVFNDELVANMGRYIYRAYISGEYFTNFADASAKIHSRPGVIYRYGNRINDPVMSGFGAFLAQHHNFGKKPITGKIELALNNLFNLNELLEAESVEPLISEFYLPETQLVGVRDKEGSNEGFYFAAKGGHNAESHNHNDVGSCILYFDGKPVLIDVGVGTYTAKTFSSRRYEIWTMQSGYHNLPVINGVEQQNGTRFKAGKASYVSDKKRASFQVEITDAYPEQAMVKEWNRRYTLFKGKKFVVEDIFQLEENNGESTLNFMTELSTELKKDGEILLKGDNFSLLMKYNSDEMSAKIEKVNIEDERLKRSWDKGVNRIVFKLKTKELVGKTKVEIIKN